ncbi:hypothetical protein BDN72DRAFT_726002, partial [Pluteus cervinus]
FPPEPLNQVLVDRVITDFCHAISPEKLEEAGCAVCCELHAISEMQPKKNITRHLNCLDVDNITRKERRETKDPIVQIDGPIVDLDCTHVCSTCRESIYKGKKPKLSQANGLWIGKMPSVLQELTFVEKLIISKLRLNCCFVRVSSGFRKMISHVIAFEAPIARVY